MLQKSSRSVCLFTYVVDSYEISRVYATNIHAYQVQLVDLKGPWNPTAVDSLGWANVVHGGTETAKELVR